MVIILNRSSGLPNQTRDVLRLINNFKRRSFEWLQGGRNLIYALVSPANDSNGCSSREAKGLTNQNWKPSQRTL